MRERAFVCVRVRVRAMCACRFEPAEFDSLGNVCMCVVSILTFNYLSRLSRQRVAVCVLCVL